MNSLTEQMEIVGRRTDEEKGKYEYQGQDQQDILDGLFSPPSLR